MKSLGRGFGFDMTVLVPSIRSTTCQPRSASRQEVRRVYDPATVQLVLPSPNMDCLGRREFASFGFAESYDLGCWRRTDEKLPTSGDRDRQSTMTSADSAVLSAARSTRFCVGRVAPPRTRATAGAFTARYQVWDGLDALERHGPAARELNRVDPGSTPASSTRSIPGTRQSARRAPSGRRRGPRSSPADTASAAPAARSCGEVGPWRGAGISTGPTGSWVRNAATDRHPATVDGRQAWSAPSHSRSRAASVMPGRVRPEDHTTSAFAAHRCLASCADSRSPCTVRDRYCAHLS
jgi:hypothetical protein